MAFFNDYIIIAAIKTYFVNQKGYKKMKQIIAICILLLSGLLIIGCSDEPDGNALLSIHLNLAPGAKQQAKITRVVVTISGPDIDTQEVELKVEGRKATGVVAIPAGEEKRVTVKAYAGSNVEFEGEAYVDHPKPGQQIELQIQLKPTGGNEKPFDGAKAITGKDGAEMVLIPAGEFMMGSNDGESDEKPVHSVYLDAYYIDIYEVTNAMYKQFMDATKRKSPEYWSDENFNDPYQPVVGVNWDDASAYATWAGKRLPTEAEWEKAARGGLSGKKYVWGDEWPPPYGAGNFADETYGLTFPNELFIKGYNDSYTYPSTFGRAFTPNGYEVHDMAGNVWEWCADWHDSGYYANSPKSNPTGPSSGSDRVLRGGSWRYYDGDDLRVALRYYLDPAYTYSSLGFRCAGLR